MTETEARDILRKHFENNATDGWHDLIAERIKKLTHPVSGEEFDADKNKLYFVVYSVPIKMSLDDVYELPEEERDKYGFPWGVTSDGRVFEPEA